MPRADLRRRLTRKLGDPRVPLILLVFVCVLGVAARSYRLGTPASGGLGQGYVFDERYYVPAARVIAGRPTQLGDVYTGTAPAGADPNGEHPQLGKLFIAGGLILLGDNATGWRVSAVVFGTAALFLLFWLVRCAGGGRWLGLGAVALACGDNLWLVHSRIAVLDIYVVPFMLAGAVYYLRRQPLIAGAVIGIGCCVKEFAAYTLLVLLLLELGRWLAVRRVGGTGRQTGSIARGATSSRRLLRPVVTTLSAGAVFLTLLAALDQVVPPYSAGRPVTSDQAAFCGDLLLWKGACNHFVFMANYGAALRDRGHPRGITAAPTRFWLDQKAITYFRSGRRRLQTRGRRSLTTLVWFRGEINRVLLFTGWLAILANLWWAIRRRDDLSLLVVAWIAGTWLPAEISHLVDARTTYLYYMVVTMPGVYIAVARLLSVRQIPRPLVAIWAVAFLWDFVSLYPIRTLGLS